MNRFADWLVRIAMNLRDDGECYVKASMVTALVEFAQVDGYKKAVRDAEQMIKEKNDAKKTN